MSATSTRTKEPIDELLHALRRHRLDYRANPNNPDGPWRAQCPTCRTLSNPDEFPLTITRNGHVHCSHKCDPGEIAEALTSGGRGAPASPDPESRSRIAAVDGATFVFDTAPAVAAIWGDERDVLWADGEPLIIAAPPGVGKTTLSQRLILARAGLRDPSVLGFPVSPAPDERILYIAADRPRQAARSLRRMVNDNDRDALEQRLVVWQGPLPLDVTRSAPETLAGWVEEHLARTIVIDSLKDIAVGLVEDGPAAKVNLAIQACIARGIQVVIAHHQRKSTADNKRPQKLDDVYGSTWITAGAGSVILLWGQPGDPIIELYHLKQPAGEVGPLSLIIDFDRGELAIREGTTIRELVEAATDGGLDVAAAARALFDTSTPTNAQVEKTRRQLKQLVTTSHAVEVPGDKPKDPVLYRPIDRRHNDEPRDTRDTNRDRSQTASRPNTKPHETASREHHGPSRPHSQPPDPPYLCSALMSSFPGARA
jgi:hypothetical protein